MEYWIGVFVYSALVVYIGWRIREREAAGIGRNEGNLEFWMARRQLPGWRLGISLASGWLMLGWIGFGMAQIYFLGATGLWLLPIPWFVLCFIIILMVPFVRRIRCVSLPEAFEKRYGRPMRSLAAVFSVFVFLSWTQAELFMAGNLMSPFLDVDPKICMAILVIPILLYTYLGGFRAIVMTDLVQFLIMAVFMVILAWTAYGAASAATDGKILETLKAATPPWAGEGQAFNLSVLGWIFPVVLLVGYLPGWMIEQDLLVRVQAARSTAEARKGAVIGLVLIVTFIVALPSIAAFCALAAFPPVDGAPPAALGGDATGIISALIATMSPAASLFMLVGLVACQMSTVDTFANVTAMPLAYDLLEPRMTATHDTGARLAWSRRISMLVIVAALGCAFISDRLGDVYYLSSGVLSASIAVPALFLFWRRTTLSGVMAASIAGCVGTIGMYVYEYKMLDGTNADAGNYYLTVLPGWLSGAYGYMYIAVGVVVATVVTVAVSLVTARSAEERLAEVRPLPVDEYGEFVAGVDVAANARTEGAVS